MDCGICTTRIEVLDVTFKSQIELYINNDIDETLKCFNTNKITNMDEIFLEENIFNGDLSCWDTSSVTSMKKMFYNAEEFNGDISSWNVTSVTTMSNMFYEAESFNSPISSWDVSSVLDMDGMFKIATLFNSDISLWDVSSVTNVASMFYRAEAFHGTISDWDVALVQDMSNLFWLAKTFNADISQWNVLSVTTMKAMFAQANKFDRNLAEWDVTSVTNMAFMFYGVTTFTNRYLCWEVTNLKKYNNMFENSGCDMSCLFCPSAVPSAVPSNFLSNMPTISDPPSNNPSLSLIPSNVPSNTPKDVDGEFFHPQYKKCAEPFSCETMMKLIKDKNNKGTNIKGCALCALESLREKCRKTCPKWSEKMCIANSTSAPALTSNPTNQPTVTSSVDSQKGFRLPVDDEVCTEKLDCELIQLLIISDKSACSYTCFLEGCNSRCPVTCEACEAPSAVPSLQPSVTPTISTSPSSTPTELASELPTASQIPTQSSSPSNAPTIEITNFQGNFYNPEYKECTEPLSCKNLKIMIKGKYNVEGCKICNKGKASVKCPLSCKSKNCPQTTLPTSSQMPSTSSSPTGQSTVARTIDIRGNFYLPAYEECTETLSCRKIKDWIKGGAVDQEKACGICFDKGGKAKCPVTCDKCPGTGAPSPTPSQTPSALASVKPSEIPSSVPTGTTIPSQSPSILPSELPSKLPSVVPSKLPSKLSSELPSELPNELPSELPTTVPTKSSVPTDLPSFSIVPSNLPTDTATDFDEDFYLPDYKKCTEALSCKIIWKLIESGDSKKKKKACKICNKKGGKAKCKETCEIFCPSKTGRNLSHVRTKIIAPVYMRSLRNLKEKDVKGKFKLTITGKKKYTCKKFKKGIARGEPNWCNLCGSWGADDKCKKTCQLCFDIKEDFYLPDYKECTEVLSCEIIKNWITDGKGKTYGICFVKGGFINCPQVCMESIKFYD